MPQLLMLILARIFDTFWTKSASRLTSFSDVPLILPEGAPIHHDSFPAEYVTDYIEDYVYSHVYSGKSLADRIKLSQEIESITKLADGWLLSPLDHAAPKVRCKKLAVVSGLTSQPNKPLIPTNAGWEAPSPSSRVWFRVQGNLRRDIAIQTYHYSRRGQVGR